jgi:hypothetical protein
MTIEHAPSTNGRVHTEETQPSEPKTYDAAERDDSGNFVTRLLMPLLLVAVALFVLRRLNKGHVV